MMINNSDRRMYMHHYYHLQRMGYNDDEATIEAAMFVFRSNLRLLCDAMSAMGMSARMASQCIARLAAVLPMEEKL